MSDRQLIARLRELVATAGYCSDQFWLEVRAEVGNTMRDAAAALEQGTPREPTPLMMDAGRSQCPIDLERDHVKWIWRAMYDAAPPLPRDEDARLAPVLRECMACMDSLRDYVAEGGSRHMIGAGNAIRAASAALDAAHAVLAEQERGGKHGG